MTTGVDSINYTTDFLDSVGNMLSEWLDEIKVWEEQDLTLHALQKKERPRDMRTVSWSCQPEAVSRVWQRFLTNISSHGNRFRRHPYLHAVLKWQNDDNHPSRWVLAFSVLALHQKSFPSILECLKTHYTWPFTYSGHVHAGKNRKQVVYSAAECSVADCRSNNSSPSIIKSRIELHNSC